MIGSSGPAKLILVAALLAGCADILGPIDFPECGASVDGGFCGPFDGPESVRFICEETQGEPSSAAPESVRDECERIRGKCQDGTYSPTWCMRAGQLMRDGGS